MKKWGIELDVFHEIAEGIFKMIDFGISPLNQAAFVGVSKGDMWIAKKKVNGQFLGGLINWATEGEDIPVDGEGCVRTITLYGKRRFDVRVTRHKE